jgi:EmrB/QacA subfamily drug resistance transporter
LEKAASAGVERKWWILIAIGVGTFMSALDGSVVNIVLPVVRSAFHTDVAAVEWVITVYLLIVSGLLLSVGRLGDLRGHKRVYVAGFVGFLAGSALCGMAPSVAWLVAFRGLQSLGAAMLFANSPAILTKSFPASQRGQALGLQAMMTYLGLMIGPSLGGWLTQHLGWRSVFYINVPVAVAAVAMSLRFIPDDAGEGSHEAFDLAGAGAFLAGLVTLLLGLDQGSSWGWASPLILGLFAAAIASLAIFVWLELHVPSPMLDLGLLRKRAFASAAASAILNYVCIYSILFLMPFYLIQGRELDPSEAGLLLTAQPVVMAVVAPFSGTLSDRIGTRLPSTIGMLILGAGLVLLSRLGAESTSVAITVPLAVSGLGVGMFVSPNTSALMGAAPRHRQGIAAGVLATSRNVGMVLGVGLSGAIFTTVLGAPVDAPGAGAAIPGAVGASFLAVALAAALGAFFSSLRER